MIKDLIKVANSLDSKGLVKEADALDRIIYKLAVTDVELEGKRDWAARPKTPVVSRPATANAPAPTGAGFELPWEVWNNLPEKVRTDFYKDMEDFSTIDVQIGSETYRFSIPILSQGTLGTKFALQCFEGNWTQAAISLAFIIISVYLSKEAAKTIQLAKLTVAQTAAKSVMMTVKAQVVGQIIDALNPIFDKYAKVLDSKKYFKPLAAQLIAQKANIKSQVERKITEYIS